MANVKKATPVKETKPKEAPKAEVAAKPKTTKLNLSVPMFTLAGAVAENLNLPKEVFGAKVNKALISQAVRVYSTNEKGHFSHTKTRGEVEGSTRKIFKQKGTGNARHGGIRAPIFVGGGIALGPKSRKTILDLPKKMRKSALVSALSLRALEGEVFGVSDLDKASGKTKQVVKMLTKMAKRSVLIVDGATNEKAFRATKNMEKVAYSTVDHINAYDVIKYRSLVVTQAALEKLVKGAK